MLVYLRSKKRNNKRATTEGILLLALVDDLLDPPNLLEAAEHQIVAFELVSNPVRRRGGRKRVSFRDLFGFQSSLDAFPTIRTKYELPIEVGAAEDERKVWKER